MDAFQVIIIINIKYFEDKIVIAILIHYLMGKIVNIINYMED